MRRVILFLAWLAGSCVSSPALACGNAMLKPSVEARVWSVGLAAMPVLFIGVLALSWLIMYRAREERVTILGAVFLQAGALVAVNMWMTPATNMILSDHVLPTASITDFAAGVADHYDSQPVGPGRTFPGGAGYTYSSQYGEGHGPDCARAPRGGEISKVYREVPGADKEAIARWDAIEAIVGEPIPDFMHGRGSRSVFQATYETGPGVGAEATAKITVMANFDAADEVCHTWVVELDVDPEAGVARVKPMVSENEFE